MRLPILKRESRYKRSIINFGGINVTGDYSPGEMRDCTGISHSEFPSVTQRKKSEQIFECTMPTAAIFGTAECIASESGLFYNRKKVGDLSPGDKKLVMLGKRIAVFPDKMYYDIEADTFKSLSGEVCSMGAKVTFTANSLSIQDDYSESHSEEEIISFSENANVITYKKASVSAGKISFSGFVLESAGALSEETILRERCRDNQYRVVKSVIYRENEGEYNVVTELVTVTGIGEDIFSDFKEGDVLEITGCQSLQENNRSATVSSVSGTTITFYDETFSPGYETEKITIGRKIPDFTSVCTYENRIWGVEGNTIYASALGDVTAFFNYKGISTDSFAVTSNSSGDFTACVAYGNSCFFFKENTCYRLYGNRPANFQLNESFASGILESDRRSIAVTGDKIIYKGNGGIYNFYGGVSSEISEKLGALKIKNATAGGNSKLYYISADTENGREEFVWDAEKHFWCKSGVTDVIGYASYGETVYRFKADGIEQITDETDREAAWSITMCPIDENYHKTKNYSRLHIKAQLFEGSYICTEIKADDGKWQTVDVSYGDTKKYLNIPCPVRSCHELQVRLSGKGKCILESITREFSVN